MNRKRGRLFYLALSVFLPLVGIMFLAAMDLIQSQENVEMLAQSYVENFTEIMVNRIETGATITAYDDIVIPYGNYDIQPGLHSYAGLGRLPALLAVTDAKDNEFLYGSKRLRELLEHTNFRSPLGIAVELSSAGGERFTVAAYPAEHGKYLVIGAISWRDLPGATIRALYLWPLLVALAALWSTIAIWRLWRMVVIPLGELEEEISNLKWGEEIPSREAVGGVTIYELRKLRLAFYRMAQDAINRVSIIRTCMNDLVSVQEAERTKISRDIHDGPLQDVTALIQRIHLARRADNTPDDTDAELDLAEKIALATVKEMRGLCDFLNPPWLELGLQQALTELTERQSAQYGIRIFLDVDEDIDFSEATTLAFFRVVQEAVTNSVRHGGAKNIWVDVKKTDAGLELCVQDDGNGFDMHKSGTAGLRAEGHRGLSNMEERMALVGGRLEIISYPGEGTCIRGLIP